MAPLAFPMSFRPALLALVLGGLAALLGCAATDANPAGPQKYSFWPSPPQEPHIQFLTAYASSEDVTLKSSKLDQLIYGKESEEAIWGIKKPYGVRFVDGKIYVCDVSNSNITILDLRQHEVRPLGISGEGALVKPLDIAVAPDGYKYVTDAILNAVLAYDANDHYVRTFKHPNLHCGAVAVYKDELYIGNLLSYQVEVYNRFTGQLLRTVGSKGVADGQFWAILGVAVDKDGNLYTTDLLNCRMTKFDHDGKFVMKIGHQTDQVGGFVRPKHLAVDSDGIIYVVDAAFQNVQMFSAKGELLLFFGGNGAYGGAMDMPAGICVSDHDLDLFQQYVHPAFQLERVILVANQFGDNKISVYGLGHLKPGKTPQDLRGAADISSAGLQDAATPRERGLPATVDPATSAPSEPTTGPASRPVAPPLAPAPK